MAADTGRSLSDQQIGELLSKIRHYELSEQKYRDIQSRLDMQLDIFKRIHKCAQAAFTAENLREMSNLIAEGVVDIFQLEMGAVFSLSATGDHIELLGECNVGQTELSVPFDSRLLARIDFWNFGKQEAVWETSIADDSAFKSMNLAKAIYTPLFNNARKFEGLILGGITQSGKNFYDFKPAEMSASFMVFSQMMNGIYNNMLAVRQALAAEKAKGQFLTNISHEMRTPLNAIIGMVQISEKSGAVKDYEKAVKQIAVSSKHLLGLVDNLLDLARIDENKLQLVAEPFDLQELIDAVLTSIKPISAAKKQRLNVSFHKIRQFSFIGDRLRLSQVLLNLLSNAVKFTPEEKPIFMDITEKSRDAQKVLLNFSVKDSGIGVSFEFQKRIFFPFERSDESVSMKAVGTGLGLVISQRIVELMGGRIELESTPQQGARFYFDAWLLPDKQKDDRAEQKLSNSGIKDEKVDFSGKRILIVDDLEINNEIILNMLEDSNATLETALNGRQALEMISNSPEGHYDLILMDVLMPIMDGHLATAEIRKLDRHDVKDLPIIAMTANAFKEDIMKCLEAGMDVHIAKPVDYKILLSKIKMFFKVQESIPGQSYNPKWGQ